jgi:hypothetical protein
MQRTAPVVKLDKVPQYTEQNHLHQEHSGQLDDQFRGAGGVYPAKDQDQDQQAERELEDVAQGFAGLAFHQALNFCKQSCITSFII